MQVMFGFWINRFYKYQRSRLPLVHFVPLALFLTLTVFASLDGGVRSIIHPSIFTLLWFLTFTMLAQFRLWDDLADLENDRINHPRRLLCSLKDVRPFWIAVITLGVVNMLGLYFFKNGLATVSSSYPESGFWQSSAIFMLLIIWYSIWYRWKRNLLKAYSKPNPVIALANLVKYPLFVFTLSIPFFPSPFSILITLPMVFLVFSIHELTHDSGLFHRQETACFKRGGLILLSILVLLATWLLPVRLPGMLLLLSILIVALLTTGSLKNPLRLPLKKLEEKCPKLLQEGKWIFFWGLFFDLCLLI